MDLATCQHLELASCHYLPEAPKNSVPQRSERAVVQSRPHLEYAIQIWAPLLKKHITSIKNVQRRATNLILSFRDLEYSERFTRLGLPTLAYRRMRPRGDMIELYKIMTGKYDTDATPNIPRGPGNQTRGHHHKIFKDRIRLNQRKY